MRTQDQDGSSLFYPFLSLFIPFYRNSRPKTGVKPGKYPVNTQVSLVDIPQLRYRFDSDLMSLNRYMNPLSNHYQITI